MNFKLHLQKKNRFLSKAYEMACQKSATSPLSCRIKPMEVASSLEFDKETTTRIIRELRADDLIISTAGMRSILITGLGEERIQELDEMPLEAEIIENTDRSYFQKQDVNSKNMKQSEKLDLILNGLYQYRNDGKNHSIIEICKQQGILIESIAELNRLCHRLKEDNLIHDVFTKDSYQGRISSIGIDFCENDSFSTSGHSVVNKYYNFHINESTGTSVVTESSDFVINKTFNEATNLIEKIRENVANDSSVDNQKLTEILDCLNEIQTSLQSNQKPKFAIKSLIELTSGITSIAGFVITLGELLAK